MRCTNRLIIVNQLLNRNFSLTDWLLDSRLAGNQSFTEVGHLYLSEFNSSAAREISVRSMLVPFERATPKTIHLTHATLTAFPTGEKEWFGQVLLWKISQGPLPPASRERALRASTPTPNTWPNSRQSHWAWIWEEYQRPP